MCMRPTESRHLIEHRPSRYRLELTASKGWCPHPRTRPSIPVSCNARNCQAAQLHERQQAAGLSTTVSHANRQQSKHCQARQPLLNAFFNCPQQHVSAHLCTQLTLPVILRPPLALPPFFGWAASACSGSVTAQASPSPASARSAAKAASSNSLRAACMPKVDNGLVILESETSWESCPARATSCRSLRVSLHANRWLCNCMKGGT